MLRAHSPKMERTLSDYNIQEERTIYIQAMESQGWTGFGFDLRPGALKFEWIRTLEVIPPTTEH